MKTFKITGINPEQSKDLKVVSLPKLRRLLRKLASATEDHLNRNNQHNSDGFGKDPLDSEELLMTSYVAEGRIQSASYAPLEDLIEDLHP
ncbi:hypothetical protein NE848_05880 [Gramella jeungdoensis]|uniref:Uncharacterized protein n=1 Tax=Gramella jeungdoensis TaxID=708091 RepID=A0ABT0YZJ4_9FLAO|nr:hypothetical protein [Gramella jeungdoensis]MCM8568897.1 hypothetical protein [Gramella jeungdoensis]